MKAAKDVRPMGEISSGRGVEARREPLFAEAPPGGRLALPSAARAVKRIWGCALVLGFVAGCAGGCRNMKKQPNYRELTPNEHFSDGATERLPPVNTVPHGAVSAQLTSATLEQIEGMAAAPVPISRELLERGQARYNIYCAVCHGEDGFGRGIVVRRGFPAPPSFHDDRLVQSPIGHFFTVMTRGYGVMYAYADRITERDRWAIAAYIRVLQRSQRGTVADLPVEARQKLEAP